MKIGIPNSTVVKINPLLDSPQEKSRLKYKPAKIIILFVGESMPNGGTFFYHKNSNLYDKMEDVMINTLNWVEGEFLDNFKNAGFYLDDLCQEPINQYDEPLKKSYRKSYVDNLAERIRKYNPDKIIITPKSIIKEVESSIQKTGLKIPFYAVSFPAQGNQWKFIKELSEVMKTFKIKAKSEPV